MPRYTLQKTVACLGQRPSCDIRGRFPSSPAIKVTQYLAACYNSYMARSLKSRNPFYALLVIVGLAFVLTATAYCVMAFREVRTPVAAAEEMAMTARHPLVTWMHNNGTTALLTELALLAVFVVGAITTDEYWQRRASNKR
jgi:hypothetical protein